MLHRCAPAPAVLGMPFERSSAKRHPVANGMPATAQVATKTEAAREERAARIPERGNASNGAHPVATVTDAYAFAFDIDGVLFRGGAPIPQALKAMRMLNGENEYGVKV